MDFNNQRAVIIGGSSGMGLAAAKAVIEAGGKAVVVGRSSEKLERAKQQLNSETETYSVDVTNESQIAELFSKVGAFDHLVISAAEFNVGPFLELDLEAAKYTMESKFWGQYRSAKYGAPNIREGGSITFFSGAYSQKAPTGYAILSSVNAAVESLGKSLAVELSPIRVNVISPGLVDTPVFDRMKAEEKESLFQSVAESLPAKRVGRPEDIAQTVMYLMQNKFTTGAVIYVDGGFLTT